jgi:protein-disulfide isomerase
VLQARDQARRIAALGDALYAGPGAVVQGNPQGDATLVEFFDYRCPYCKRGWQTIKRLIEEDPNLRVVFRQFPIKDAPGETISYDAARAALAAARQGKYLAFHDAVFANPTVLTKERVMEIAAKVGLDMDRLKKDMADPAIAQGIEESMMMAATLRLTGTPSYVVGESIISGLISYEGLEQRIAAQRAAGRPAVAGGR